MRVGLDLDGVVADYHSFFIQKVNKRYGLDLKLEDWTDYEFSKSGIPTNELWSIIKSHAKNSGFRYLNPVYGARKGVRELRERGHSIHIITHRFKESRLDTLAWLDQYNIEFESLSFTNEKGEKGRLAQILGIDIAIEDSTPKAQDFGNYGIKTLLLTRPWNKSWKEDKLVTRVSNWKHILSELK